MSQQNDRRAPPIKVMIHEPKNQFKVPARIRSMSRRRQKIALVCWLRKGLQAAMFAPFRGRERALTTDVLNAGLSYLVEISQPITFTIDIEQGD